MDNAVWHRVNLFPQDRAIGFLNTYPLHSDLADSSCSKDADNDIHRINLYPGDSATDFPITYPLDSDLSDG